MCKCLLSINSYCQALMYHFRGLDRSKESGYQNVDKLNKKAFQFRLPQNKNRQALVKTLRDFATWTDVRWHQQYAFTSLRLTGPHIQRVYSVSHEVNSHKTSLPVVQGSPYSSFSICVKLTTLPQLARRKRRSFLVQQSFTHLAF